MAQAFPLTGGTGPLTRGVGPQRDGLRAAKGCPYGAEGTSGAGGSAHPPLHGYRNGPIPLVGAGPRPARRRSAPPIQEKTAAKFPKEARKIPAVPAKEQRGSNLQKTEKRLLLVRGFLSPGNSQAQLIQLLVVRPQNAGILWGPVGIKMLGRNEFALRQGFALAGKTLVRRIRAAPSAMGPLRGRPGNVTPPRRSPLSG